MKNFESLLESHHETMAEMYACCMDMMKEYMNKSLDGYMALLEKHMQDSVEEPESKEEDLQEDLADELEEEMPVYLAEEDEDDEPVAASFSEGYAYDDLGDPIVSSFTEEDIDLDDPSFSYGKHMGIPQTLVLNFSPRGKYDSLIPEEEMD